MAELCSSELKFAGEAFFVYLGRRGRARDDDRALAAGAAPVPRLGGRAPVGGDHAAAARVRFLDRWEQDFRERNGRDPSPNSLRAVMQAIASFYRFWSGSTSGRRAGKPLRNPALALEAPTIRPAAELDWLKAEEDEALLARS